MEYKIEYINLNDKEYELYIGKNAKGNEQIINRCHPESIWFHLNNVSSAHIILETKGDDIEKRYINMIACKLLELKKNKPKNTKVIYTKVKNIKLTNKLGTVTTKNTKVIKV